MRPGLSTSTVKFRMPRGKAKGDMRTGKIGELGLRHGGQLSSKRSRAQKHVVIKMSEDLNNYNSFLRCARRMQPLSNPQRSTHPDARAQSSLAKTTGLKLDVPIFFDSWKRSPAMASIVLTTRSREGCIALQPSLAHACMHSRRPTQRERCVQQNCVEVETQ